MTQILRLRQSSNTLADFQGGGGGDFALRTFGVLAMGQKFATAKLVIDVIGTSTNDLFDNLITLKRTLESARRNYLYWQANQNYTPIYLQFQPASSTTTQQAECFGLDDQSQGAIDNLLASPQVLLSNRIENLTLNLRIRGYFEESSAQTLVNAASHSNTQTTSTCGASTTRGDLPAPLKILVRTPTASQDTLVVAMRTLGAPTSYPALLDAEGYTTRGSGVADLSDANLFPGSGVTAQRWTPPATSEQLLLRWTATHSANNSGRFRVFVRCRDNAASTPNIKLRVRGGLTDGSNFQYGDYGDVQKYVNTVAGTTALSIVDCGVITLPPFDTGGALATTRVVELRGQADSTSTTFDIDFVWLFPVGEDAVGNGICIVTFPQNAGTGAAPDMVIDANDRVPQASLETSGVPLFVAQNIAGAPLFAPPNQQFDLWIFTLNSSNYRHTWNANNTVTVTTTPRYMVARGA